MLSRRPDLQRSEHRRMHRLLFTKLHRYLSARTVLSPKPSLLPLVRTYGLWLLYNPCKFQRWIYPNTPTKHHNNIELRHNYPHRNHQHQLPPLKRPIPRVPRDAYHSIKPSRMVHSHDLYFQLPIHHLRYTIICFYNYHYHDQHLTDILQNNQRILFFEIDTLFRLLFPIPNCLSSNLRVHFIDSTTLPCRNDNPFILPVQHQRSKCLLRRLLPRTDNAFRTCRFATKSLHYAPIHSEWDLDLLDEKWRPRWRTCWRERDGCEGE